MHRPLLSITRLAALLMLCPAISTWGQGTSAFRCQEAGRTIYQAEPCALGSKLDLEDRRTEQQRRDAVETTNRAALTAEQVARSNALRWHQSRDPHRSVLTRGSPRAPATAAPGSHSESERVSSRHKSKKPFTVRVAAPQLPAPASGKSRR